MMVFRGILLKNFLIVYGGSQWLRSHFSQAGLLILTLAVAGATFGLDTRQTLAFQIFAFSGSLLLLAILITLPSRGKFSFKRILPEYGTVGQILHYRIDITNQLQVPQHNLILLDQLRYSLPGVSEFSTWTDSRDKSRNLFDRVIGYPRLVNLIRKKRGADVQPVIIDQVQGNQTRSVTLEMCPLRRGYIEFGITCIGKHDPFGLFRKLFRYRTPDRLLVLPKCYKLPRIPLGGSRKYHRGGLNLASSVGDSEEFMSLREYRPGDSVRSIHWRSYAKRGEPITKEYQDEYFARLGLVLDTCAPGRTGNLFEDTVSIAASVIAGYDQQDALLDLLFVHDRAYRLTSGRGLADMRSMLEVLACVDRTEEDNFLQLSELVLSHAGETSGLILITQIWDRQRVELVRKFVQFNIPLQVILICTPGNSPDLHDSLSLNPESIWVLESGSLEQSIAGLWEKGNV